MHPDLHTDLDNLDSVEKNLRSAKGSLDAYDVTFSLTVSNDFVLPGGRSLSRAAHSRPVTASQSIAITTSPAAQSR